MLQFTPDGLLPPGDHVATFDELRASSLALGPPGRTGEWDAEWRRYLIDQAEVLVRQLWSVGIEDVFLNGSFVEDKAHPNDIDGYFAVDARRVASGELERRLNEIDPHAIWTWDQAARRPYRGYVKKQLPMWHAYRVELYPHYDQFSGITDAHGIPLTFPSAFRTVRLTHQQKGIIRLVADQSKKTRKP